MISISALRIPYLDQHLFCMRLDMAVDGVENVVSEVDVVTHPWLDRNPYGNVFLPQEIILKSEGESMRMCDSSRARTWKISHATKKNPINGKPTAYKLIPFTRGPAHPASLVHPNSEIGKKGQFASAHLWVTAYDPDQRFPAGEHTPQGNGSVGVLDWIEQDRDLVGKDVVLWHAFGVTHMPRVEDFPVMPVEVTGFSLKPDNFFTGNPAIDSPPEVNGTSQEAMASCSSCK